MKNWRIVAVINKKEVEFLISRYGKDGLPLETEEAIKEYVMPHVREPLVDGKIEIKEILCQEEL